MDRVREIFLYFVAALSMFAMLCAVYQAMNGKNGSALTLGGLFLVGALIVFIPQLEALKAWGIEAKLSRSLDRAEEIIERLRRLSAISAKATYMTMAWGNRMGAPSVKDKQAILDEIDNQLTSLNVTVEERNEIIRPYVHLIGFDFYQMFVRVLDRYATWKSSDLAKTLSANPNDERRRAVEELSRKQSSWRSRALSDQVYRRLKEADFGTELQRAMPEWLDGSELRAVDGFRTQLIKLIGDCERKGGYTPEAAEFYDRYHDIGGWDLKIKELFGSTRAK